MNDKTKEKNKSSNCIDPDLKNSITIVISSFTGVYLTTVFSKSFEGNGSFINYIGNAIILMIVIIILFAFLKFIDKL